MRLRLFAVAGLLMLGGCDDERVGRPAPRTADHANSETSSEASGLTHWIAKCNGGDGQICALVGHGFETGASDAFGNFPQDYGRAAEFYSKGCRFGTPRGCGGLGALALAGHGVEKDQRYGAELVVTACERGDEWSCLSAGNVFLNGTGVRIDRDRALDLYSRGCVGGNPGCCTMKISIAGTGSFSDAEPPTGAAGFRFDISPSEAERLCRTNGHVYRDGDASAYCDGTPSGLPFETLLGFCEKRVCALLLVEKLRDREGSAWLRIFNEVERDMTAKYGTPTTRKRQLTEECAATDDAFRTCLAGRRAVFQTTWVWAEKTSVVLALEVMPSVGPTLQVDYSSPLGAARARASGL